MNGLYTFGQPRVGNKEFCRNFDIDCKAITYRFINNNDVVTRVPTRSLGYRHVGQPLYIDVQGKIHTDIHWWNKFLDRVKGRIEDLGKLGTDGIKDHSMEKYVKNLKRKVNKKKLV